MNAVTWLIVGALIGWLAFAALRINASRGLVMSLIIGAMAAYFGGSVLAPLFGGALPAPGGFNAFGLLMASAFAAGCVYVADVVYERFGV